jgi:hypothetical protein
MRDEQLQKRLIAALRRAADGLSSLKGRA